MPGEQAYRAYPRPADTAHGYPYLVVDGRGALHLPLTAFAKEACGRLAPASVGKYLAGILPWFTWLETDPWPVRAGHRWDGPPAAVRGAVREYLVGRLGCQVRERAGGYETIKIADAQVNRVRLLLTGLKLYYRLAALTGHYRHPNPLAEPLPALDWAAEHPAERGARPRMPAVSGVDAPPAGRRLTDSYFLLVDAQWVPRVVTDPHLCQRILAGGRTLAARGKDWGLREECAICLLFETGARVSEVLGLTLDDWWARGLGQTAWARNKGSRRRRAKFVRFSPDTAKLLRRYGDTTRAARDPQGRTFHDYLALARDDQSALDAVPLFLSRRGTPWSVASFRAHYWKPACAAAGLDVDIHQARHWYVTQAMAEVEERSRRGELTTERGAAELVEYMQWRSGAAVLAAYNHATDATNHARTQDRLFRRLRESPAPAAPAPAPAPGAQALYDFLIGTGGIPDDLAELFPAD
jgi:integrase